MVPVSVSRTDAFGIRVADAVIDALRASSHTDLEFPCRRFHVSSTQARNAALPTQVDVEVISTNGFHAELTINMVETGVIASATANIALTMDSVKETWLAVIHEDEAGTITFTTLDKAA